MWYVRKDGSLDMGKLMQDWQEFWREDGHLAAEGFLYREAGPHLMLMAFLQRIVNGGGRIEREYGLGRGSLDLLVFWKNDRHLIELKIRRGPRTEGIALKADWCGTWTKRVLAKDGSSCSIYERFAGTKRSSFAKSSMRAKRFELLGVERRPGVRKAGGAIDESPQSRRRQSKTCQTRS
jgi:hypothetical protein